MAEIKITLKAARHNASLTQQDVVEILHISPNTLVNWENGKTKIDAETLNRLCDIYQIPIENIRL